MAYLTYEEYQKYPLGVPVTEAEFPALEYYAEKQIDAVTHGRVDRDAPPPEVREATALQVACLAQNGGVDLALGGAALTGESLGSYSYSAVSSQAGGVPSLCSAARGVLWPTGLLFAGAGRRRW